MSNKARGAWDHWSNRVSEGGSINKATISVYYVTCMNSTLGMLVWFAVGLNPGCEAGAGNNKCKEGMAVS